MADVHLEDDGFWGGGMVCEAEPVRPRLYSSEAELVLDLIAGAVDVVVAWPSHLHRESARVDWHMRQTRC